MKNTKRNKINLVFAGFLVIAYIICTVFFSSLAVQLTQPWGAVVQILITLLFGLLLFYATRVGEGRQVKRFSLAILLLVDLPCLCILLFSFVSLIPAYQELVAQDPENTFVKIVTFVFEQNIVVALAGVTLGYAIPYTFLSGYELKEYEDETAAAQAAAEDEPVLEGGLAEELALTEAEEAEAEAEADADMEIELQEIEE